MKKAVLLVLLASLVALPSLTVPQAYAANCMELGNCQFDNMMTRIVYPYRVILGDWIYPIFWGSILGILYMRNNNTMLVSFIGIILAGLLAGTDSYITSATGQAFYMGYILVTISISITLFILFKSRLQNP